MALLLFRLAAFSANIAVKKSNPLTIGTLILNLPRFAAGQIVRNFLAIPWTLPGKTTHKKTLSLFCAD